MTVLDFVRDGIVPKSPRHKIGFDFAPKVCYNQIMREKRGKIESGELMKISEPNIIGEPELVLDAEELINEARADDADVTSRYFKDAVLQGFDLSGVCFKNVIFENCRFTDCIAPKTGFIDVIFKACDLSNGDFADGYFKRCVFSSCKLMGTNLQNSGFQSVTLENCNAKYAALDKNSWTLMRVIDSDMSDANISECKLKDVELVRVKLAKAVLWRTALKKVDLTTCELGGITISDDSAELRGATVNATQAVELARLLGVTVV